MARKTQSQQLSADESLLADLKKKFMRSQDICEPARKEWITDWGYYDGPGQWSDAERAKLAERAQPDNYFNHVKPAVNGVIGIVERGKTDPKAWGRTPKDTDAAEVATDVLRYVADVNRFQTIRAQTLRDFLVPGVCVGVVEIDAEREVKIRKGRPEEFFYDPHSREHDFSDASYLGLAKWMDEADALALTDDEDKKKKISQAVDANGLIPNETHEDRPVGWAWADNKHRRVMVVEIYCRRGSEWRRSVFVSGVILEDEVAPYRDDKGRSFCNLIAESAYVDNGAADKTMQNARCGIVRDMRGPQDGINKGRSKAQHLLNVRQVRVDPGIKDVDEVRRQAARPDGVFEYRKDAFEFVGSTELAPAHVELMRESKMDMQRVSPTPSIVGRQNQGQSGRAILAEQQAGMTEMALLFGQFDDWTLRIYRAVWYCVRQYWDAPRYIRVTDDELSPRYVMMNGPEGQIDPNTGKPIPTNKVAEMDVDIIIDSTPDTATLQEEQFNKLIELESARPGTFPTEVLIEASSLPKKKHILDKMKKAKEEQQGQPNPMQIEAQKEELKLQSAAKMKEMDAAAHMQQLQRDDQADEAKFQRSMMLEDKKFENQQRSTALAHQADQAKRDAEFEHGNRQAEQQFQSKQREGALQTSQKATQAAGDEQDDMKIELPPELAHALASHVANTKSQVAESQTRAASAQEQVPQALMEAANALRESAAIQAQVAQETLKILKAPKKLVKGKDGSKSVVSVMDAAE